MLRLSIKVSSKSVGCWFGLFRHRCGDISQYVGLVQEEAGRTVVFYQD